MILLLVHWYSSTWKQKSVYESESDNNNDCFNRCLQLNIIILESIHRLVDDHNNMYQWRLVYRVHISSAFQICALFHYINGHRSRPNNRKDCFRRIRELIASKSISIQLCSNDASSDMFDASVMFLDHSIRW
jgi:histidinol phosphatase-like PHP family hydrolase